MAFSGFSLPDINTDTFSSEKEIKQVKDYLYQLTEQMKYTLSNLDEENMTTQFLNQVMTGADGSIAELSMTAQALSVSMRNAENEIASLQLTASGLTLALNNNKLVFDERGLTIYNSGITADSGKLGGWTLGTDGFYGTNTYIKANSGGNVYARFGYMYFCPQAILFGSADAQSAGASIYLDETLSEMYLDAGTVGLGRGGGTVVLGGATEYSPSARIIVNGKDLTAKLAAL